MQDEWSASAGPTNLAAILGVSVCIVAVEHLHVGYLQGGQQELLSGVLRPAQNADQGALL